MIDDIERIKAHNDYMITLHNQIDDMLSTYLTALIKDYILEIDGDIYILDFIKHPSYKLELMQLISKENFDLSNYI